MLAGGRYRPFTTSLVGQMSRWVSLLISHLLSRMNPVRTAIDSSEFVMKSAYVASPSASSNTRRGKRGHSEYTLTAPPSTRSDLSPGSPAARFLAEPSEARAALGTRSTRQSAYSGNWCRKRSTWPPKTGRSRTNSAAERLQEPSRMIRSVAFNATRSISVSLRS
jgi:hypothetical protein